MFDLKKLNKNDELWTLIEEDKSIFEQELYKEINKEHFLHGIKVKGIARREDRDDVLFALVDCTNRYAIVHLTWTQKTKSNSSFPKTRIYDILTNLYGEESY